MALQLSSHGMTLLQLHNATGRVPQSQLPHVLLLSPSIGENHPQKHSPKAEVENNSGTRALLSDRSPLRRDLQTFTDINENLAEKGSKNNIQRRHLFIQLLLSTTQHCLTTELTMIKMDTFHLTFARLIKTYS